MDGFLNGKFFKCLNEAFWCPFVLVPIWESLSSTQGASKRMAFKITHFMSLEELVPLRPFFITTKITFQKSLLDAIECAIITKVLFIQLEKSPKNQKNCFMELFCTHFGRDGLFVPVCFGTL